MNETSIRLCAEVLFAEELQILESLHHAAIEFAISGASTLYIILRNPDGIVFEVQHRVPPLLDTLSQDC